MLQVSKEDLEHFVQPTEDKIDNLGPGCFVRVHDNGGCYWTEIESRDGDHFTGTVHKELSSAGCKQGFAPGSSVQFDKEQIVLLGCDNYCWC